MTKIAIDIGHGTNTKGKGVTRNGKSYREHNFNSILAKKLKSLLEKQGFDVTFGLQKPNSRDVGLRTRTNWYNKNKVDLVVSVHANANKSSKVSGRCVFYWGTSSNGKSLAQRIAKEIKEKGYSTHGNGLHAGKRYDWTDLHITRETRMPAVLIEYGFMTNAKDFELIFGSKQGKYTTHMAEATAKAVTEYFGKSYKGNKSSGSNSNAGAKLVKKEDAYFLATENIKVRSAPNTSATHTGTLPKGASVNYKSVYEGNGYRWLQYIGNSGSKLYLPYRSTGKDKTAWGTFHDKRPGDSKPAKLYKVQTGAFADKKNAQKQLDKVIEHFGSGLIVEVDND